jgi:hypothetical protein
MTVGTTSTSVAIDWHCCMNGGAVRARMNLKSASELMHPGDHPRDANSHAERLPALVCGNFLSAPPVIADDQIQFLAYKSEIDGDARRGRVAIHVGQRLLDNAEQRLLKR